MTTDDEWLDWVEGRSGPATTRVLDGFLARMRDIAGAERAALGVSEVVGVERRQQDGERVEALRRDVDVAVRACRSGSDEEDVLPPDKVGEPLVDGVEGLGHERRA